MPASTTIIQSVTIRTAPVGGDPDIGPMGLIGLMGLIKATGHGRLDIGPIGLIGPVGLIEASARGLPGDIGRFEAMLL
jgi:hypothetical protein